MKKVLAVLCVLALTPAMSRPQAAGPNRVIAPDVPQEIEVPDGHVPFLRRSRGWDAGILLPVLRRQLGLGGVRTSGHTLRRG